MQRYVQQKPSARHYIARRYIAASKHTSRYAPLGSRDLLYAEKRASEAGKHQAGWSTFGWRAPAAAHPTCHLAGGRPPGLKLVGGGGLRIQMHWKDATRYAQQKPGSRRYARRCYIHHMRRLAQETHMTQRNHRRAPAALADIRRDGT
jgi:hypothetical protein